VPAGPILYLNQSFGSVRMNDECRGVRTHDKMTCTGLTSLPQISTLITAGAIALTPGAATAQTVPPLRPSQPFLCAQHVAISCADFNKIRDDDYQPAIEAGIAQNLEEIRAIADNPRLRHSKHFCRMEKSGRLIDRVMKSSTV